MLKERMVVSLTSSGRRARVVSLIGEGGQGTVYEAETDGAGGDAERLALKWYLPHSATDAQRLAISMLVEQGPPSDRFLWPLELAGLDGDPAFGYVMPLRPANYAGMVDLLSGRVDVQLATVCTVGYELADSFLQLHNRGLCYRDVSYGNVFLDPKQGRVLICDNDNVGIDGQSASNVLGTRRFMAPEIVRGEAVPSTRTDLFSLSVLLFYLLMVGHPLLGRRELDHPSLDGDAERLLFGVDPVFVFDPVDSSNAPVPGVHDAVIANWNYYPRFIRELFTKAFTTGLDDPQHGRVRESVWRLGLARLRDLIMECSSCGRTNIYDEDEPDRRCWSCENVMARPLRLRVGRVTVVLRERSTIYRHHLRFDYDFTTSIAGVAQHPQRPELWGLQNLTEHSWDVRMPDGSQITVEPNRSVSLVPGIVIDFGDAQATLEL
jgi:serine/threonine protein kinase